MSPLLVLIVAVLATTYAGPIVRLAAAPAVAIAFWRLVLVLPVTFGVATRERQPTRAVREAFPLMLLSGLLLATHFWTWIASLKFTSVASSVLLVSLKPVFAWAVAALWLGEHPGRTERRGIALAVAGATLIGLGDARLTRAGGDRDVVEDRTGDGAWPCGLNRSGGGRSKPGTTSTSPWSTGPASSLPTWAIPTSSPTGARRRSRSRPCRSPRTGCSSGSPSRLKSSRCAARRTRASRSTWRSCATCSGRSGAASATCCAVPTL